MGKDGMAMLRNIEIFILSVPFSKENIKTGKNGMEKDMI